MNNRSTVQKIVTTYYRLLIAIYRYFRNRPSTCIDFATYPEDILDDYMPEPLSPLRATRLMDKLIDGYIKQYGITEYKAVNLYKLDSDDLNIALLLIKHGLIKPDDFKSDETLSQAMSLPYFPLKKYYYPDEIEAVRKDPSLNSKALLAASNKDEYGNLQSIFISYEQSKLIQKHYTERIKDAFAASGIAHYLGKNLYHINNVDLLEEALEALEEMDTLIYTGIESYKEKNVRDLSLFELEKLAPDTHDRTCPHFGFNTARREEFLKEIVKYEGEEEYNEQLYSQPEEAMEIAETDDEAKAIKEREELLTNKIRALAASDGEDEELTKHFERYDYNFLDHTLPANWREHIEILKGAKKSRAYEIFCITKVAIYSSKFKGDEYIALQKEHSFYRSKQIREQVEAERDAEAKVHVSQDVLETGEKEQKRIQRNAADRERRAKKKAKQQQRDAREIREAEIEFQLQQKRNAAARERRATKKAEAMREMNKKKTKATTKAKPAKTTTASSRKKATA